MVSDILIDDATWDYGAGGFIRIEDESRFNYLKEILTGKTKKFKGEYRKMLHVAQDHYAKATLLPGSWNDNRLNIINFKELCEDSDLRTNETEDGDRRFKIKYYTTDYFDAVNAFESFKTVWANQKFSYHDLFQYDRENDKPADTQFYDLDGIDTLRRETNAMYLKDTHVL